MGTHLYEVDFAGGEIAELAANIITELIYAHCDVDKNKCLLLKAFIDHKKNCSAFSVEDQKVVVKA